LVGAPTSSFVLFASSCEKEQEKTKTRKNL